MRRGNRRRTRDSCSDSVDLLTKILVLLPAKTVIRFQCVSKHWLSVISSFDFQWQHTQRQISTPGFDFNIYGLYFNLSYHGIGYLAVSLPKDDGVTRRRPPPPLPFSDSEWFVIDDSCNGLLLCWIRSHYAVCNLTSGKHKLIPVPDEFSDYRRTSYLAFDPSKSPFYKIVALESLANERSIFYVYSSETVSWKMVPVVITERSGNSFHHYSLCAMYWNGGLHWIVEENGRHQNVFEDTLSMIRFDVATYELSEIKFLSRPLSNIRYFGKSGGNLLVIVSGKELHCFVAFEMHKDYSGWRETCRFDLNGVLELDYEKEKAAIMCAVKAEKENHYELVLVDHGRVVSYHTKSKALKVLPHTPDISLKSLPIVGHSKVYPFYECLVPV